MYVIIVITVVSYFIIKIFSGVKSIYGGQFAPLNINSIITTNKKNLSNVFVSDIEKNTQAWKKINPIIQKMTTFWRLIQPMLVSIHKNR